MGRRSVRSSDSTSVDLVTANTFFLNIRSRALIGLFRAATWLSVIGCNVPKPIFLLETLIVHCLLLFGYVFVGLLMKLRIRVYIMEIIEMKR
jgi:hypothetical protein